MLHILCTSNVNPTKIYLQLKSEAKNNCSRQLIVLKAQEGKLQVVLTKIEEIKVILDELSLHKSFIKILCKIYSAF